MAPVPPNSSPTSYRFAVQVVSPCYAKNLAELNAESGSIERPADRYVAQAARIECGDERLRMLTLADALTNLAEIKRLLLDYERRLLN